MGGALTSLYFSLTPSPASIQSLPPLFHPHNLFRPRRPAPSQAKAFSQPALNFCGAPRGAASSPPPPEQTDGAVAMYGTKR